MESIGNIARPITKRKIFSDKFEFDGYIGRTARVNISDLGTEKNRRKSELPPFSGLVPRTGIEPVLLRTGV